MWAFSARQAATPPKPRFGADEQKANAVVARILSHRPTGSAYGRPEDRFRPVPMSGIDPGLRACDENQGLPGSEPQDSPSPRLRGEGWGETHRMPACAARQENGPHLVGHSGARALPVSPETMNTSLEDRVHEPVFIASGPGPHGPSRVLALSTVR